MHKICLELNVHTFKRSLCSAYFDRIAIPVALASSSILEEFRADCIACASSSKILKTCDDSPFYEISVNALDM